MIVGVIQLLEGLPIILDDSAPHMCHILSDTTMCKQHLISLKYFTVWFCPVGALQQAR